MTWLCVIIFNFQRSRERNRVKNEVLSYEGLSHGANRLFAALSKFLQFIISPKRDKCRKTQIGCQKISVIDIGRRKTIFAALSFYRRCALSKWHTRPCLECAFQQAPRYQEINPIWMILICNRIFFKRSLKIPFPTKNLRRKRIISERFEKFGSLLFSSSVPDLLILVEGVNEWLHKSRTGMRSRSLSSILFMPGYPFWRVWIIWTAHL